MQRARFVFVLTFALTLLVQGWLWTHYPYLDSSAWASATATIRDGGYPSTAQPTFGYPGTLLILPAGAIASFGVPPETANIIVMVVLLSLGAACIAACTHFLRPERAWWRYVTFTLAVTPFYLISTPPTALAMLAAILVALLTLMIRERPHPGLFLALGAAGALGFMSRFDTTAVVFGVALLYLLVRRERGAIMAAALAGALSILGIPMLWSGPLTYLHQVLEKIGEHTQKVSASFLALDMLTEPIVFGLLGLIAGLVAYRTRVLPRDYTLWLAATTVVGAGALLVSSHHPPWLFYPFLMPWMLLLPLFVLELYARSAGTLRRHAALLLAVLVLGQALSLVFQVVMPVPWDAILSGP
ncbi:MAG TPA: hypothetical protein VEA36_00725 [Candidatus Paceibacterota bacterium]|nr:hypothetical protein [Candidatus Paceibacterota bacterium]